MVKGSVKAIKNWHLVAGLCRKKGLPMVLVANERKISTYKIRKENFGSVNIGSFLFKIGENAVVRFKAKHRRIFHKKLFDLFYQFFHSTFCTPLHSPSPCHATTHRI